MEAVGSAMEAVGGRTDEWGEFVEHKVTIVLPGLVDFANQFREGLEEYFKLFSPRNDVPKFTSALWCPQTSFELAARTRRAPRRSSASAAPEAP